MGYFHGFFRSIWGLYLRDLGGLLALGVVAIDDRGRITRQVGDRVDIHACLYHAGDPGVAAMLLGEVSGYFS